jgi:hypothetical protein
MPVTGFDAKLVNGSIPDLYVMESLLSELILLLLNLLGLLRQRDTPYL